MQCQNQDVFQALLDYMYTGNMVISGQRVPELLRLANHFLIEHLKQGCIAFLERNITAANCFSIKEQIERSGCLSLVHTVESFILCNIGDIVQHEEVLEFTYSKLEQLISSKVCRLLSECHVTPLINMHEAHKAHASRWPQPSYGHLPSGYLPQPLHKDMPDACSSLSRLLATRPLVRASERSSIKGTHAKRNQQPPACYRTTTTTDFTTTPPSMAPRWYYTLSPA